MNELAIISLLVSLIFADLVNLVPGGIIVPFYVALYLDEPVKVLVTVLIAIALVGIMRLLSSVTILYGRRKFALYIVLGLILKIIFTYFYAGSNYMFFNLSMTIGHLVPGILGSTMERQGIVKTTAAMAVVVFLIKLIQIVLM